MKELINRFVIMTCLLFSMWCGSFFIMFNMKYTGSKEVQEEITLRLENSGLDNQTMESCRRLAKDEGVQMEIRPVSDIPNIVAEVIVTMQYEIPVIGKTKMYTVSGYVW